MLKVNNLVKNDVFSPRFFLISGRSTDQRSKFPLEEQHRDLLSLIMALHYIECQEPLEQNLVLKTRFINEFKKIKKDLETLFFSLTGKKIKLFFRLATPKGTQTILTHQKFNNPTLFSGGIDSICGAIKILSNNSEGAILHVNSSKSIFGKVRKVLSDEAFDKSITYYINARIKSSRHRSFFSNTRGMLFVTAGYVVSKVLGGDGVFFCENGSQMLDIMVGSIAYNNAVTTQNTNLNYLQAITNLLSEFDGSKFSIYYPLKNQTKSEAISKYLNQRLIQKSWSCYSTRNRSRMCGSCWNCFTTSMSATAAGFPETLAFEVDPLSATVNSIFFSNNQRILYNMLVFYSKVIKEDKKVMDEIEKFEDVFSDPKDLAIRFGSDIFLGVSECLSKIDKKNGLGKKADELLSEIDRSLLRNRKEKLLRNRL